MAHVQIVQITAPEELRQLRASPGFCALLRSSQLTQGLAGAAARGAVVTCALAGDELVGYAADLPFLPVEWEGKVLRRRWERLPTARELGALEVARPWRRRGLSRLLLSALVAGARVEEWTLIAEGLCWHWDLEAAGLRSFPYRALLLRLLQEAGFAPFATDLPDVRAAPENFLAARLGARTPAAARAAFLAALAA